MMERPDALSWAQAASTAEFVFFELIDPVPDHRWAGGFGGGDEGTDYLEVLHDLGGVEVAVATRFGREHSREVRIRQLMFDLLWHEIAASNEPVVLPLALTLMSKARAIVVDGEPVTFDGVDLDGAAWAGTAVVGDVTVSVTVRDAGIVPSVLGSCDRAGLLDRPADQG